MRLPVSPSAAWLLPVLLCLALPLHARDGNGPLPAWEQLSPQQRQALVAPVRERWNANPEQRARMLERAERWQRMSPEERERAHQGVERWRHLSAGKRTEMRALYGRLRELPEVERAALRERWKTMTPAERKAWTEANPVPARRAHDDRARRP